jgi:hypothetical protein
MQIRVTKYAASISPLVQAFVNVEVAGSGIHPSFVTSVRATIRGLNSRPGRPF